MTRIGSLPRRRGFAVCDPAPYVDRPRAGVLPAFRTDEEFFRMTVASPAPVVLRRLLDAHRSNAGDDDTRFEVTSADGRPLLSIRSSNRQGVTLRLHAGAGAREADFVAALKDALAHLEAKGRSLC